MELLPAELYGKIDKKNPVISSFESEIKEFMLLMKRVSGLPAIDAQSYAKGSKKLFEIWNKYKVRLPAYYFEEQMVQIADFLSDMKMYRMALWQGYDLYLQQHSPVSLQDVTDVDQLKSTFFPKGFQTNEAALMLHALQARCLCAFKLEREVEEHPSQKGLRRLQGILGFLRILMQAVVPLESLCWVLHNGSLQIYNICRYLMSSGCSAQALEYLLWACMCMETSVPLLTVRFLPWRATLYCAVCQCYYDSNAGLQAEVFARRALSKVNELAKLEEMSCSPSSSEMTMVFREATIKLAAMLFKRVAYEPGRKSKGVCRPKQKGILKEAPWHRTITERLLMEMFEGHAAQLLAVIEALWDTSHRPLHTGIPEEPEMQEVAMELLSVGVSILTGIGDSNGYVRDDSIDLPPALSGIDPSSTLLEMAKAGKNTVSVEAAVKFVKLLFLYRQWDMFRCLSRLLVPQLKSLEGHSFKQMELELALLEAVEPLINIQKSELPEKDKLGEVMSESSELLALAETLHASICGLAQSVYGQDFQPDRDLVIDIVHLLWARCKAMIQSVQSAPLQPKYSPRKLENQSRVLNSDRYQWAQTMYLLCKVSSSCNFSHMEPMAMAEMAVLFADVLENTADSTLTQGKSPTTQEKGQGMMSTDQQTDAATTFKKEAVDQLQKVLEVVEHAVESINLGTALFFPCDGTAVYDTARHRECACPGLQPCGGEETESTLGSERSSTSCCDIIAISKDLHLELLAIQHRVALKVIEASTGEPLKADSKRSLTSRDNVEHPVESTARTRAEAALLEKIGKNKISKAMFLMQKALLSHKKVQDSCKSAKLLEEAVTLVEKTEVEEKRLISARPCSQSEEKEGPEGRTRIPPPPILLSRTHHSMTFAPAPFSLDKQVRWYNLHGREAKGINLKVRLGDCCLPGTGEQVPAHGDCVLWVNGLEPNHTYVFAVAAYDAKGKLVGGTIGETTRPLLASLPLPLLTTWGFLAQVAYQTGLHGLVEKACRELWDHFTHAPLPRTEAQVEPEPYNAIERLSKTRLCSEALQHSSPLLLQLFLKSIFMQTDIHVQEGALYCDVLSDGGPLIWGQVARLAECEHLLVALELALWLNDTSSALQAVVGCYGLLAPLIYHKVQSEAVVQVVIKCLVVLQEIPGVFHQKHPISTAESLLHMVACMTFYVSKVLRLSNQYRLAAAMIDRGRKLLQEANDTLLAMSKTAPASMNWVLEEQVLKTAGNQLDKLSSKQLRALEASATMSKIMSISLHEDPTSKKRMVHDLVVQEDICVLFSVISSSSLKTAFHEVMKYKWKPFFLEIAVHLLQRGTEEDELELVLKWGQDILSWLSRRNEAYKKGKKSSAVHSKGQDDAEKDLKKYTSSVIKYSKNLAVRTSTSDRKWRKQLAILRSQSKEWETWALNTLRRRLPLLLRRCQQRRNLRRVCWEETSWRCHLNLKMALCHLALLHRSLEQWHGFHVPHSYSHLDPMFFSLANVGSLVKWRNAPQYTQSPKTPSPVPKEVSEPHEKIYLQKQPQKAEDGKETTPSKGADEENNTVGSEVDTDLETPRTQVTNDSDFGEPSVVSDTAMVRSVPQHLDSLTRAALHLRRAMVLAHRGAHWTSLQWTCRVLWDQTITITQLVERGSSQGEPTSLTRDQVYTSLTPLLVLAADLLLDMMYRVKLWKAFRDDDVELEASLHFSNPVDDVTLFDFRWLRMLVLRVLELLHLQEKWETLAYLALQFNGLTHERYTHIVTPLLVHAQRKLLERVHQFGGPPPPQPHFSRTEKAMGLKITCRNYVGKQLLSAWIPKMVGQESELQRALVLISVPLDVEDTLSCFREMTENVSYAVQTFRHSRTLFLLLLADTQPNFEVPFCKEGTGQSQSRMESRVDASVGPRDLSNEDFSSLSSIYSCPLPPSQLQTAISAYTSSIKYLQANNLNSLSVLALHDLGNLYFYKGNKRAAQTYWNKALDSALQCSGVLESWDGVSWAGCAPQEVLYRAGIWGCLQGAILTARIAQYLLTSDVSQRTRCCLLSAMLFRTLLSASLPHPQSDRQYASYMPGPELIPGLDLFSEPIRANVGTVVASLSFLCHWLYSSAHFLKVLPLLSLYLHIVGTVCRDSQRIIEGRILKVRALTELGLFRGAMREFGSLLRGENIPQPHGNFLAVDKQVKEFDTAKALFEPCNLEALEELVHRRLHPDLALLFGPRMNQRLDLARGQLLLALCCTIHSLPESQGPSTAEQGCPEVLTEHSSSTSELNSSPTSDRDEARTGEGKPSGLWLGTQKENLTPCRIKGLLLQEVSHILTPLLSNTQLLVLDAEELEVAVEVQLLLSNAALQQGKAPTCADHAVAALHLLQDSPLFEDRNLLPTSKLPYSNPRQSRARSEQGSLMETELDYGPWLGDLPFVVEASERLGPLWLRCQLAVVRALAEHLPGTAIHTGVDSSAKAAKLLEEALQDTQTWNDPETRALLLLQGALLNTHSGRPKEENISLLEDAAGLLSDSQCLSHRAALTLAAANLQLSELKSPDSHNLHLDTQTLLQQQLSALGERITLGEGGQVLFPTSLGLINMYLPQLPLLAKATMHLGQCLAVQAVDSDQWLSAQRILHSALQVSQASSNGDRELQADILYCRGLVESRLVSLSEWQPQDVVDTFLEAINITQSCSHNLRCYLEMALVYLRQWELICSTDQQSPHTPSRPEDNQQRKPGLQTWHTSSRTTIYSELQLLLFYLCLRAAAQVSEAHSSQSQLCGVTGGAGGGDVQLSALEVLPQFVSSDLLIPCGRLDEVISSPSPSAGQKHIQLTWIHLARYQAQLLNLHHIATRPVAPGGLEDLCSLGSESGLTLRLAQLHSFFSTCLPSYREQCCAPKPPTALLQSTIPQAEAPVAPVAEQKEVQTAMCMSPLACADTEQLCMQWHHPVLDQSSKNHNMVLLLFAFHPDPLSGLGPTAGAISQLHCGQLLVSLDRLEAIHGQLCCLCAGATVSPSHPASPTAEKQCSTRTSENGLSPGPHFQELQEKTRACVAQIRALLKPHSDPDSINKEPKEPGPQNLPDLERCFNPLGGAVVTEAAMVSWMAFLLL